MNSVYYVHNRQKYQRVLRQGELFTPPEGSQIFDTFEEYNQYMIPERSLANFVDQCHGIPGFTDEVANKPGWLIVQERLKREDYAFALTVFGAMSVPRPIIDAMLPLAVANDLPQPVIDALSSSS
jgi:hypothetical protein